MEGTGPSPAPCLLSCSSQASGWKDPRPLSPCQGEARLHPQVRPISMKGETKSGGTRYGEEAVGKIGEGRGREKSEEGRVGRRGQRGETSRAEWQEKWGEGAWAEGPPLRPWDCGQRRRRVSLMGPGFLTLRQHCCFSRCTLPCPACLASPLDLEFSGLPVARVARTPCLPPRTQ